jgi:NADH-quinone oxidoreductase subunit M
MISLLLLESAVIGVFCARDLFLFYVFWEAMLIPMALLIGIWGGPRRVYASVKFFLYTMAGSVLMLIAVLYVGHQCQSFSIDGLPDLLKYGTSSGDIPVAMARFCFLAFALAFAVKVPLFPVHTWLPDAHVEAPTAGSVILAGVLLKMGAYGFIRIALPFFPEAALHYAPTFVALAVISVIFGALMSMAQSDIKKLIAYSSVSHMGFVVLGIFSFNEQGMQGAILQMVNHGISTGALFLLVGVIYDRTHRRGVDDFGGLTKVMPKYAALFLVVTLSSIGLPGLNGFVGEFLVLCGAFLASKWAAALAATGVILGALYMLTLYRGVFFGKLVSGKWEKLEDLHGREIGYLAPLILLIAVLGIVPSLVLKPADGASKKVVKAFKGDKEADRGSR